MNRDVIEDIEYTTIWSVTVGRDRSVLTSNLYSVMNFNNESLKTEYKPSKKFIVSAKQEIASLEWSYFEENGQPKEQVAYCYVLRSNPNKAICSNNLER